MNLKNKNKKNMIMMKKLSINFYGYKYANYGWKYSDIKNKINDKKIINLKYNYNCSDCWIYSK